MKLFTILSILSVTFCVFVTNCNGQLEISDNNNDNNLDLAGNLSALLVNSITKKVQNLVEVLDLKFRLIRFLRSLYTTDNLELIRRSLNLGVRFSNWILSFLPATSTESPGTVLLNILFPELNIADEDIRTSDSNVEPLTVDLPTDGSEVAPKEYSSTLNSENADLIKTYGEQTKNLHDLISGGNL